MDELILWGLRIAGAGQVGFGCLHRIGMRTMRWREDLAKLQPLNAQIFLSLFGYITAINVGMGLLDLLAPGLLLDGSAQALLLSAFVAVYWSVRLCLQLFHYRWHEAPGIVGAPLSRAVMIAAFVGFSTAHWLAVLHNLGVLGD